MKSLTLMVLFRLFCLYKLVQAQKSFGHVYWCTLFLSVLKPANRPIPTPNFACRLAGACLRWSRSPRIRKRILCASFAAQPIKSLICTVSITLNIASSDIRRLKVAVVNATSQICFELRSSPLLVRFRQVCISFQYIALFRYRGLGVPLPGLDVSNIWQHTSRHSCLAHHKTEPNPSEVHHPHINDEPRNRLPWLDDGVMRNWNHGASSYSPHHHNTPWCSKTDKIYPRHWQKDTAKNRRFYQTFLDHRPDFCNDATYL